MRQGAWCRCLEFMILLRVPFCKTVRYIAFLQALPLCVAKLAVRQSGQGGQFYNAERQGL